MRGCLQRGSDPRILLNQERGHHSRENSKTLGSAISDYIQHETRSGRRPTTLVKYEWLRGFFSASILGRPVGDITRQDVAEIVLRLDNSGKHNAAKRLANFAKRVFNRAMITGAIDLNPATELAALVTNVRTQHHPALTDPHDVGKLLRKIGQYSGRPVTQFALTVAPHVFLRPGELRQSLWTDVDFENGYWMIPAERMKMGRDHIIPVTDQVMSSLRFSKTMLPTSEYIFPAHHNPSVPISENTLNQALKRMGFKAQMTAHGFRSLASTLLNEMGWNRDWIEMQLAHSQKDAVRASYNRATYLDQRRRMMCSWSNYLDALRDGCGAPPNIELFGASAPILLSDRELKNV